MTEADRTSKITRRGFVQSGAGALATTGIFAGIAEAGDISNSGTRQGIAEPNSTGVSRMSGKITLEEHFALPEGDNTYHIAPTPDFQLQMVDLSERRLADMDRGGVEICTTMERLSGGENCEVS
jgi:hypothetical protein